MLGVIGRVIPERAVAEELLHDVFLKIWNKIEQFEPEKGRLFTWMLNIARNAAIDKTRSREASKAAKTKDIENFVGRAGEMQAEVAPTDFIGVRESLAGLPEDQRFVVEHLYFKGYTQSELAEAFDIPLGTVKTRLRLAMMYLRNYFATT